MPKTGPAGKETMTAPHEHIQSTTLQPLPDCLAPDPDQRAAFAADYPTYPIPEPGDQVIIDDGYVTWLIPLDDARPLTAKNTLLAGAPLAGGTGCHGAEWASASTVDPDDGCLDFDIAASLQEARRLLIEDAAARAGAGR